jgi:hypothetical protein
VREYREMARTVTVVASLADFSFPPIADVPARRRVEGCGLTKGRKNCRGRANLLYTKGFRGEQSTVKSSLSAPAMVDGLTPPQSASISVYPLEGD